MLLKIFLVALTIIKANSLRCVSGASRITNEVSGTVKNSNITCKSDTKFCVKLATDATINGEYVKASVRGCDQELAGSSKHQFCKTESCTNERSSSGTAEVCCCADDYCNDGNSANFLLTVLFATLFLLHLSL